MDLIKRVLTVDTILIMICMILAYVIPSMIAFYVGVVIFLMDLIGVVLYWIAVKRNTKPTVE